MLKQLFKRFSRNERGAVALMFGLSAVPVFGLVGAAVDYNRASATRMELQAAADATSLSLAKSATALPIAQAIIRGQDVFNGNWNDRTHVSTPAVTISRGTDTYRVQASAQVRTVMLPIIGINYINIGTESVSGWGVSKIEIALVLDNTGSMGWSSKMQELKKALCGNQDCSLANPTSGFIYEMRRASQMPDQIRIGLVPFDTTVRVPMAVQTAVNTGSALNNTFSYSGAGYCGSNPTAAERVSWSLTGAPPTSWFRFADRDKDTRASDRNASNVWVGTGCGTGRATRANWLGCLWDRDQSGNRDTNPNGVNVGDVETLYPAVNCRSDNLARMAPLVDVAPAANAAQLISQLGSMQPSGNTNLTIGVTWGANTLLPGAPMSTAATNVPGLPPINRFMILLTDGDNTENRTSNNASGIDPRARLACQNAKAQGITIFAIRVIEGNQQLLRDCSSGPGFYYEVSTAAQLDPVFKSIAGRIGSIRLTN
jgi:hypothetical protein